MIVLFQTNLHGHRAEYVDHAIAWAEKNNVEVTVWIRDSDLKLARTRFEGSNSVVDVQVGSLDFPHLNHLKTTGKTPKLVFLDGDRELVPFLTSFRAASKFKTTFLLMRMNFPSGNSVRDLIAFLSKFSLALAFNLFSKVTIKRLVFLRKSQISVFGQVRDPLPRHAKLSLEREPSIEKAMQIGIVGTIDERKSIELAIESVSSIGPSVHLNLVGQVTDSYKDKLCELVSENGSVTLTDKYLTDDELVKAIGRLDCFLVLQKVNAPSGTILRALDSGIPVVVGGSRVLKRASKIYPNMVTWTKMSARNLSAAIESTNKSSKIRILDLPSTEHFAEDLMGHYRE
jgi:glycosyltransferase involved in cell wall biosynthesis